VFLPFKIAMAFADGDFQFQQSKPNEVEAAVKAALTIGYRHIDAAAVYGNEAEVGRGIKASGVDRKDIFVRASLV
jgi:L-glyceraldehyde reductase